MQAGHAFISPLLFGACSAFRRKALLNVLTLVCVAIIVMAFSALAVNTRANYAGLIPLPTDLVANIWSGIVAAIGAIYLQRVVMLRKVPETLVLNSLDELPYDLVVYTVERKP